ncbi:hypothetical protein D3C71_1725960 [compost metagenome]
MLLEWQGDIESEAVIPARTFVGGGHDAATGTGNDHQVRLREFFPQLPGLGIQRVFDRCSCRAENGDLASPLELLQYAKGMFQFAKGLQGDLGIPAIMVLLGHAQDR